MALPYDVVRVIEEAIPDRGRAEKVIRAIEEGLHAVRREARAQKEVLKAELKGFPGLRDVFGRRRAVFAYSG